MILEEVGGANDGSWSLLPYLFVAFMTSNIWSSTAFNVDTGGFNNNIHCWAKCISAVIAGSEFVKAGRGEENATSCLPSMDPCTLPQKGLKSEGGIARVASSHMTGSLILWAQDETTTEALDVFSEMFGAGIFFRCNCSQFFDRCAA